ncbi:chemotaxis protein CheW [Halodesulfovibrio marinisediminis]|uniref:histidine kinase n=1 Tax=Halodesulfovibrio marinisediminis DSM 17456 TaxID=1121457 RepID=A0A1N6E3V5_9BACT|nr:chemotaxis protein CheW [Halodesulfovibrio marinisediminis]SIN77671.1 CheW-like domain-containing protein [Halodesulfovibrio marinisediminis DSM 17456]
MLDDVRIQCDSAAGYLNHSELAATSAHANTDSQLCTMFYVRLTLQSDLANETPASIFAAHKEQGTIFYLPELTALPALDEYTVGKRYLQYHVLIQSPLQEGVEPTCPVFESLGSAEVSQLGIIESEHSKDATAFFSQYFLSFAGRGHADISEIAVGLQNLLQPLLIQEVPQHSSNNEVAPISQASDVEPPEKSFHFPEESQDSHSSAPDIFCEVDDAKNELLNLEITSPISELEFSLNAPRGTADEIELPDVISNGSSASYIAKVCDQLVPSLEGDMDVPASGKDISSITCFTEILASKKFSDYSQQRSAQQEEKLDRLISHVSELSGIQSKLYDYALTHEDDLLRSMADEFDRLYCVLRDSALELRMVSLEPSLIAVKEWLEDAVQAMSKQIEFSVQGADVQVDAIVAEALTDALSAYFSSSISLVLSANDPAMISLSVEYSGTDVLLFLKHTGSTVLSGRDNIQISEALLGLQAEIFALHGAMAVEQGYQGETCVKVSFPVTKAMIEGLIVQCGDEQYLVPMNQISECVDCNPRMGVEAKENKVILGGETIPCVRLREYVELDGRAENEQCVIIQSLSGTFGLIVDGVVGELQAAVKPVGFLYEHIEMISGVSIKADGVPCLVLNLQHLQTVADCLIIN